MNWEVIQTGARRATENMLLDESLLQDLAFVTAPILHLYDWERPSATYGYFVDPAHFLLMENVEKKGLELARRPTGGGIVFHVCDLAFSVLMPSNHPHFSLNPLENYAFVNRHVMWAIKQFLKTTHPNLLAEETPPLDSACRHFCMAKPTKYDVMIGTRKVGGAAQRKTRHGYLHQGSIAVALLPDDYLLDILKPETQVLEGMKRNSFSLLEGEWTLEQLLQVRLQLTDLLQQAFVEGRQE